MKKRTNEEKRQMIDDACDRINEAGELIKMAKELFKSCGIEFCEGFTEGKIEEWNTSGSNLLIFKGTKKLCDIIGVQPQLHNNCMDKLDKSRCYTDYKGIRFVQLGDSQRSKFIFR